EHRGHVLRISPLALRHDDLAAPMRQGDSAARVSATVRFPSNELIGRSKEKPRSARGSCLTALHSIPAMRLVRDPAALAAETRDDDGVAHFLQAPRKP